MRKTVRPTTVPAAPEQWSEKSKQSVAFGFRREYKDKHYRCWHCQSPSIFTAQDQKYTFEVLKASKDQNRVLCRVCWLDAIHIRASLRECEEQWNQSKVQLQVDRTFLAHWLALLVALEKVWCLQARYSEEEHAFKIPREYLTATNEMPERWRVDPLLRAACERSGKPATANDCDNIQSQFQ